MRLSTGVEWALHCCVSLCQSSEPVPAQRLAELHQTPPSYLAKQLQALSRAGIVQSTLGQVGGYSLMRPPQSISVLEIVRAIDGQGPMFRCSEIRQRGPLAVDPECCSSRCAVARLMDAAEEAWAGVLATTTVDDLAGRIDEDGEGAMGEVARWLSRNP